MWAWPFPGGSWRVSTKGRIELGDEGIRGATFHIHLPAFPIQSRTPRVPDSQKPKSHLCRVRSHLLELNPQQREAVEHFEGPSWFSPGPDRGRPGSSPPGSAI